MKFYILHHLKLQNNLILIFYIVIAIYYCKIYFTSFLYFLIYDIS